jgi:hypothetical protein
MFIVLSYPTGRQIEGILLAAGPNRMRIVVRRLNETMELQRTHGEWQDAHGQPVEVAAWVTDGSAATVDFASSLGHRVSVAGS